MSGGQCNLLSKFGPGDLVNKSFEVILSVSHICT